MLCYFLLIRYWICVCCNWWIKVSAPRIHYLQPHYLNSLNKSSRFTLVLRQVFYSLCSLRSIFAIIYGTHIKCLSQALPFSGCSDLLKQDNWPGFDVPVRLWAEGVVNFQHRRNWEWKSKVSRCIVFKLLPLGFCIRSRSR